MHHIYKTRAIVLNHHQIREADKQLVLLTQDFGLIRAIAQGTRKNESKLRQSIQDFSVSDIALVKGKVGWRLTNAQIDYQLSAKITDKKIFKSIIRVFNLIERLVLGESEDQIFETTIEFIEFAQENNLNNEQIKNFETIFVIKILNQLGYVDLNKNRNIIENKISTEMIDLIDENQRRELNKIINRSIKQSGL